MGQGGQEERNVWMSYIAFGKQNWNKGPVFGLLSPFLKKKKSGGKRMIWGYNTAKGCEEFFSRQAVERQHSYMNGSLCQGNQNVCVGVGG